MWWDKTKNLAVCYTLSSCLYPSQVDLFPHPSESGVLTVVRETCWRLCPHTSWTTGLQSLEEAVWVTRRRRTAWNVLFFSKTEALAVKMVFCFVFPSTPVIQLCHLVISPLHPVILLWGPSVAPDIRNTITHVPHPSTPSTPSSVFFDDLCFYRTLMAVFKTHCDVWKKIKEKKKDDKNYE